MTQTAPLVASDYTAADPMARHLAENYHIEAEIKAAVFTGAAIEAQIRGKLRWWSNFTSFSMVALLLVWLCGLISRNFLAVDTAPGSAYQLTGALMVLSSMVLLTAFLLGIGRVGVVSGKHEEQTRCQAYLQPIAGTDLCQTALQYVKDGPAEVAAWRDQAITERGQLYAFDVEVMRAIVVQDQQSRSSEERRLRNDQACRELHGVSA